MRTAFRLVRRLRASCRGRPSPAPRPAVPSPPARPLGASGAGSIGTVSTSLAAVPVGRRRRLAGVLAGFAVLLAAIAVLAAAGRSSAAAIVCCVVAGVAAVVLGLMAWGVVRSVQAEQAERTLDAELRRTLAASGALACGCGHDHDPDELHVRGAACAGDGRGGGNGVECAHDCESCTLAALRGDRPVDA